MPVNPPSRWPFVFLVSILCLAIIACRAVFPEATPNPVSPTNTPLPPLLPPSSTATLPVLPNTAGPTQAANTPQTTLAPISPVKQNPALLPPEQNELQALSSLTQYDIQVELNLNDLTFQGQERAVHTNTEDVSLEQLNFRLLPNGGSSYGNGSLTVTQVSVAGQPTEAKYSNANTVLEVQLPQALAPGEQMQIEFEFNGMIPRDFGGSATPEGYGIYNFSQGVLTMASWYPQLAVYDEQGWNLDPVSGMGDSVYADMAFFTVDVTAPSDLILAATGVETSRQAQNGVTQYQFVSGPVREFFITASENFQVESQTVAGTKINSYFLQQDQRGGQAALQIAAEALQVFNDTFGVYPYTELDVIEAPMRYAAGVEFPGIVMILDDMYDSPQASFFVETVAHEVAHQWWYNLVGNDVFDDPWLDEALTTYSSALYFEAFGSPSEFEETLEDYQSQYRRAVQLGYDAPVDAAQSYFQRLNNPGAYGSIVYAKGALFFQAVRETTGDQAFFQALQTYFSNNKYKIAQPEDLLNAFESVSGKQLDDLYQEWLD